MANGGESLDDGAMDDGFADFGGPAATAFAARTEDEAAEAPPDRDDYFDFMTNLVRLVDEAEESGYCAEGVGHLRQARKTFVDDLLARYPMDWWSPSPRAAPAAAAAPDSGRQRRYLTIVVWSVLSAAIAAAATAAADRLLG